MKKFLFYTSALCFLSLMTVACNDEKNLYQGGAEEEEEVTEVVNTFDFSTVTEAKLQVSYQNIGYGDYTTSVYFEVYAENPITEGEHGTITRNEGVNPVYTGYTSEEGIWSGEVELPAYAETVYVYSPAFFAQTLMSAEVSKSSTIVLSDASYVTTASTKASRADNEYETTAVSYDGWKTWLGAYSKTGLNSTATDYTKYSGGISYANKFESDDAATLNINAATATELLSVHQKVINIGTNSVCPDSYRTSKDLTISKDASVAITLLGGDTGWSSSMGYYYYDEDDDVPTSRSQITPILIVPNTQDGQYTSNGETYENIAKNAQGIERGTTVQLYYYGPADKMSEDQKSATFPAGTKIGFILKSHAWPDGNCWDCDSHDDPNGFYSTTTPGLNTKGNYSSGSGVAMYTPDGENLLISFEDHSDDENFSDVVFTMSTNPVGAFTDVNTAQQSKDTVTIAKGVYAYEDLWPSKGDYDMNDVIVEASAEKVSKKDVTTITTTGSGAASNVTVKSTEWYLASETFIFTPYSNYAQKTNGLAFTYVPSSGISSSNITGWTLTVDGKEVTGATYDETEKVFYLTENVKNYLNKELRLTVNYVAPVWDEASKAYTTTNVLSANEQSKIKPFIYRSEGTANWEVHIPYEAPTSKMNTSYFYTEDDLSNTSTGAYYVRSGNYPFAFYLAGATISNVSKLLIEENEKVAIDELYPKFLEWAQSNGASSTDWYK